MKVRDLTCSFALVRAGFDRAQEAAVPGFVVQQRKVSRATGVARQRSLYKLIKTGEGAHKVWWGSPQVLKSTTEKVPAATDI